MNNPKTVDIVVQKSYGLWLLRFLPKFIKLSSWFIFGISKAIKIWYDIIRPSWDLWVLIFIILTQAMRIWIFSSPVWDLCYEYWTFKLVHFWNFKGDQNMIWYLYESVNMVYFINLLHKNPCGRALRVRTSLRAKRAMRPAREARGPPRGSPRPGRPHRRFAPIRLALGGGTPAEAKLINKFYARRRRDAA